MENTVLQNNIHLHNGLMAYWPLDGNSTDAIGDNDGTDTSVSYVDGKIDQCGSFNGSTSFIELDDAPYFALGANNFAIQVWVKRATLGTRHSVFCQVAPNGDATTLGFNVEINDNNYLTFNYYDTNSALIVGTSTILINDITATWHHLVITRSGNSLLFYKDGILGYNLNFTGAILTDSPFKCAIGKAGELNALHFNGQIDEVAFWNRTLSEREIKRLYNGGRGLSLISKSGGVAPEAPPEPEGPIYGIINQTGLVLDLHSGDPDSYPGTGTSWFDKSPAASAASVISGSPVYTNGADPNKYFTLTGSPHFVTTPINIQGATNANLQTIGAWHRGMVANQVYFGTNANSSGQSHLCVRVASATTIRFEGSYYGGGTGESVVTSGTLIPNASGWNYVVAVKTASSLYDIYFNGVRVMTNIMRNSTGSVAFICLGKVYNTFIGPSVHGALHVYNRALTGQEILDNYNAQLPYYSL